MKGLALLALAVPLWAQATAPSLPKFAGCGSTFSDPGWLGWCGIAVPLLQTQGLYSWTMYQFLPNGLHSPTTTTSTGVALVIRQFTYKSGWLNFVGVGAAGVAVSSTATSFSPSGGGLVQWVSKQGWTFQAGGIENKVGNVTKPVWVMGPGMIWGSK